MKTFLILIAALFSPITLIVAFFMFYTLPVYDYKISTTFFLYLISFLLSANISVVCMVGVGIINQMEKASPKTTPAPADSKSTAAGSSPYEEHAPAWVTPYETGAEIPAYLRTKDTEKGPYEGYTPSWVTPDEAGEEVPANLRTPSEKDIKPPKKKKKSKK
ncbi:MAG: hypothetical protein K6F19_06035 [Oscillospiraceae bacterium]|nr:hypothetical protein [Oscillospiraceae bacterium]